MKQRSITGCLVAAVALSLVTISWAGAETSALTARNASATVPAQLLVVLISEPGEPVTAPKK